MHGVHLPDFTVYRGNPDAQALFLNVYMMLWRPRLQASSRVVRTMISSAN